MEHGTNQCPVCKDFSPVYKSQQEEHLRKEHPLLSITSPFLLDLLSDFKKLLGNRHHGPAEAHILHLLIKELKIISDYMRRNRLPRPNLEDTPKKPKLNLRPRPLAFSESEDEEAKKEATLRRSETAATEVFAFSPSPWPPHPPFLWYFLFGILIWHLSSLINFSKKIQVSFVRSSYRVRIFFLLNQKKRLDLRFIQSKVVGVVRGSFAPVLD